MLLTLIFGYVGVRFCLWSRWNDPNSDVLRAARVLKCPGVPIRLISVSAGVTLWSSFWRNLEAKGLNEAALEMDEVCSAPWRRIILSNFHRWWWSLLFFRPAYPELSGDKFTDAWGSAETFGDKRIRAPCHKMFLTGFEPRSNRRREGINVCDAGLQGHRAEVVFRDTRENSDSRLSQIFSRKLAFDSRGLEGTVGVSRETFCSVGVPVDSADPRVAADRSGLWRKTGSDDVTEGGPRALMCQNKENLFDLTHNVEFVHVTLGENV